MTKRLGQLESTAFAYAQMRSLRQIAQGELCENLGITPRQERDLLGRMARRGLIARVRRGLYLFPSRLPLGGVWTPDEATAVNALMEDCGGTYQITGPNAFQRYGFDEQISTRLFIYNDALSGERSVGQVNLTLIKVATDRLGSTESIERSDGQTLVYSSRARTLVDAVYDWSRFDTLPRAFGWIRRDIENGDTDPKALVKAILKFGNQGAIRRVGAVLEELGIEESLLKKLSRALRSTTSQIPFDPTRPKRGPINKRWGVARND